jgi:hypothetical protein
MVIGGRLTRGDHRAVGSRTHPEGTDEHGEQGRGERHPQGRPVAVEKRGRCTRRGGRNIDGRGRRETECSTELEGRVEKSTGQALFLLLDVLGGDDRKRP